MKTCFLTLPLWLAILAGCTNRPLPKLVEHDVLDLERELADFKRSNENRLIDEQLHARPLAAAMSSAKRSDPKPLPVEGTWYCSGWMGDAENPAGRLKYELCRNSYYSEPTCDKWIYLPPASGELGWVAVAYQGPKTSNWGKFKGIDLSGRGYTRLTFMARGERGGERIVVTSGGHTNAGEPFPASYELTLGMISLEKSWTRYELEFPAATDLSNICSIFAFSINRAMAPDGCTFYLDDMVIRGNANE
jgi:hypothetical protein